MDGTVELICMIIRVGIQCAAQLIPCIVPIVRSCYMLPVWYFANLSFCHFSLRRCSRTDSLKGDHFAHLRRCALIGASLKSVALLHRICAVHCTDWLSIERWPQCYHSESHRMGSAGWGGQDAVRMVGVDRNCDSVQWWEVNWVLRMTIDRNCDGRLAGTVSWPTKETLVSNCTVDSPVIVGFNSHLPWFARVRRDLICFPVS